MATLDATTQAEYAAEVNAADRAQVIVDALADPVTVNIYNGSDAVVGSGTMTAPWATVSGYTVVTGTLDDFFVSSTGVPDDDWYLQFESGARTVRFSFGLSGSSKEAVWSLTSWTVGTRAGISAGDITATGNRTPVWSGAPAAISGAAGSTQSFASYVTDPDDDALTFSLVSATNGYSITTAGVLTIGTASQSVTIRVTDPDGLTADWSVIVNVTESSEYAPDYPRLAAGQIGGFSTTFDAARWDTVAKYQVAVLGGNRWWSAGGYNGSSLATYLKAANPAIKLFKYTNLPETYYADTAWSVVWNKLAAEDGAGGNGDWWLRTAAGAQITGYTSTQRRVNFTSEVTPDANGWRWPEWFARFWYLSSGELTGLTGQGIKDGPYDGFYEDNQYIDRGFTASGDYNEDGVDESGTSPYVVNLVVQGHVAFYNACKAIAPALMFGANQSAYLHPTDGTMDDRLKVINDLGWMEDHSKYDYYNGWATMMAQYRRGIEWLRPGGPKIAILNAHLYRLIGWLGGTNQKWNRYMLCSTLMDNGWYMPTITNNGYAVAPWFDEFDWNLGQPTQTPRTIAYSNGVYLRQFDNGLAIVNPKGNGTQNITLPSAGTGYRWDRLSVSTYPGALTDSSVNTGATNVTSVSITAQDGLILKRVNA